jgi:hypothetical protein
MSALHDRRPGLRQHGLPGLEHDRLWSRQPDRTGDPLDSPDGCRACAGTGTDLAADPPCPCGSCSGSGWS